MYINKSTPVTGSHGVHILIVTLPRLVYHGCLELRTFQDNTRLNHHFSVLADLSMVSRMLSNLCYLL